MIGANPSPCGCRRLLALLVLVAPALVAPLAAQSTLDPTFGGDGTVITSVGTSDDAAYAIAIQVDGRIVVTGACRTSSGPDFCLARYDVAGNLDPSFGGDGTVTTAMSPLANGQEIPRAVAIQADGKIVVAGLCQNAFCLARHNTDGSLDPTFSGDGKVVTGITGGDVPHAVAIQGDGKIVAAGYCLGDFTDSVFCLARYNPNGSLDTTFGGDGTVTTPMSQRQSSVNFILDIAIQTDGHIVAAGYCEAGVLGGLCLARFHADGSLDPTFGEGGAVVTPIRTHPNSSDDSGLALQLDGKVVIIGSCHPAIIDFCLARYNSDGSLDTSFGGDGTVSTPIGTSDDIATGVAVLGDGRIVATGYCQLDPSDELSLDFCLARFNADGSLDTSFGGDGTVTTPIGTSADAAWTAALQLDGKIVLAGSCRVGAATDFCLARYEEGDGDAGGSAPGPPTSLTATPASPTQINLSWQDNSNNEDGFAIERCLGVCTSNSVFTEIAAVGANVSSYSNTGLTGGTTYSYRVRAYNANGRSISNIATATTPAPPPQPPAAPGNLIASALSNQRVQLTWRDNSVNESRFEIERRRSGGAFAKFADVAPNTTSYRDTGLSRRTIYEYRVRGCNDAGCSAYSNVASVRTR